MAPRSTSETAQARAQAELRRVLTRVVAVFPQGLVPELRVPHGQSITSCRAGSPEQAHMVDLAVDELMLGRLAQELLTAMMSYGQACVEAARPPPPSQRPTAPPIGPPPVGWEDELTPLDPETTERALTGDMTRLLPERPPTKTVPSWPAPPPIPDALSKRLRDAKDKGGRR